MMLFNVNYETPFLPPELILHIFENSAKDELIACSSVSRSWRNMSLQYRFDDVVLRYEEAREEDSMDEDTMEGQEPLLDSQRNGLTRTRKDLLSFLDFLRTTPDAAAAIRALTIDCISRKPRRYGFTAERFTFLEILATLPNLHDLSLSNIFLRNWRSQPAADVRLDSLTIRYPGCHAGGAGEIETAELLEMLTIFRTVKRLNLEQFTFASTPDILPFPQWLTASTLTLRRVWAISPFLESLRQGDSLRGSTWEGLQDLRIMDLQRHDLLEMNWCLEAIGYNLVHFGCFLPFEIRSQFDTVLNLEYCHNLRSLTLYLQMVEQTFMSWVRDVNQQAWDYLFRVLSGLPFRKIPLTLDQFTLSVGFSDIWQDVAAAHKLLHTTSYDMGRVDALLAACIQHGFIRKVRIELRSSMNEGCTLPGDIIPEFFPLLRQSGGLIIL